MSRTTTETNLQSPAARSRLAERAEPYYRNVQQGLALGYRRGRRGGTWLARIRHPQHSTYREVKLGRADDEGIPADGGVTFTFDQALREARKAQAHEDAKRVSGVLPGGGKRTVNDILDEYEKGYISGDARRGEKPGRDIVNVRSILNCHVRPALGDVRLDQLTSDLLKQFKTNIANAPRLTRNGLAPKIKKDSNKAPQDEREKTRKRRSRANRIMTPLRAALNYAVTKNHIASDVAWRVSLKAYAEVDSATVRYLNIDECHGLQKAAEPDFAQMVKGALLTGCRYGTSASSRSLTST